MATKKVTAKKNPDPEVGRTYYVKGTILDKFEAYVAEAKKYARKNSLVSPDRKDVVSALFDSLDVKKVADFFKK